MLGILFGGFILAWILHPGQIESDILKFVQKLGTSNKGELIEPVDLNNVGLMDKQNKPWQWLGVKNNKSLWTIVSPVFERCNQQCEEYIHNAQQVHKRLDKYASRVQRVILTDNIAQTAFENKGIVSILQWNEDSYNQAFDTDLKAVYFIVDPRGNAMMSYSADQSPADLLDDLKFLLKNSP